METFTFARLPWVLGPEDREIPDPVHSELKQKFCRHRRICYLCGSFEGKIYNFFNGMHRCRDEKACDERYRALTDAPITVALTDEGFRIVETPLAA